MSQTMLVDGDLLIFSICAAAEYGNDPADVDFGGISNGIDGKIRYIQNRLGADDVKIFLSGKDNFRKVIVPSYKANRDGVWRPYHLKNAVGFLKTYYDTEIVKGLEADDLLAINQKPDGSTTIVTLDKDLLQVKGSHYRWETQHAGERQTFVEGNGTLSQDIHQTQSGKIKKKVTGTGALFFAFQLLIGDPTDGVTGCAVMTKKVRTKGENAGETYMSRKGIGEATAYDLLRDCSTYKDAMAVVIYQYKKMFGTMWKEQLLAQGRVLYMVRQLDGNKALLWNMSADRVWFDLERNILCD